MSILPTDIDNLTNFRATALEAEAAMLENGALAGRDSEKLCPVKHEWAEGCYIREWNCPAGVLTVSKIHKIAHPFFVMSGEVSVLTEHGVQHIVGPYHGVTPAGTKRVLYTHTPTQWVTVHVTEHTDLDKIEEEIIAKDFTDPTVSEADLERLMEKEE